MNTFRRIGAVVQHLPVSLLVGMVRIYQYTVSPLIGHWCRFQPTCSNYFILSVKKHGALGGSIRGVWRICRCNPFSKGGFDPP